jgi:hypothetical protein
MDPIILNALIALGIAVVTVFANRYLSGGSPAQTPVPSAPADGKRDPFAGLPGLPGHPILNSVVLPWLQHVVSPPPPRAVSYEHSEAAGTMIAALLKHDPAAFEKVKAQLSA